MFFHFTIFIWTVAFFLSLELLALNPTLSEWNGYGFSILFLSCIAAISVKKVTKKYSGIPIPLLFAIATPTLLFLIDKLFHRQLFAFLASIAFYSLLLGLYRLRFAPRDETARAFLSASAMAALFLFFASMYGLYLNFTVPLPVLLLSFFLGTLGIAYQTFFSVSFGNRKQSLLYASFLGLVSAEAVWVASFWPFGYLTSGAVLLVFFSFLWEFLFSDLSGVFSQKRMYTRAALSLFLFALLLSSSPWRMVV